MALEHEGSCLNQAVSHWTRVGAVQALPAQCLQARGPLRVWVLRATSPRRAPGQLCGPRGPREALRAGAGHRRPRLLLTPARARGPPCSSPARPSREQGQHVVVDRASSRGRGRSSAPKGSWMGALKASSSQMWASTLSTWLSRFSRSHYWEKWCQNTGDRDKASGKACTTLIP